MTGLPREAIEDYDTARGYRAIADSQKAYYYMQLADVHYGLLGNIEESRGFAPESTSISEEEPTTQIS